MPGGIPDQETFNHWLASFLAEDDPNGWLDQLPGSIKDGVLTKRPVLGMNYDTLHASMGQPDKLTRASDENRSTMEIAVYGAISVVLKDGVVVRISDPGRQLDEVWPGLDVSSDAPVKSPIGPETQGVVDVLPPPAADASSEAEERR